MGHAVNRRSMDYSGLCPRSRTRCSSLSGLLEFSDHLEIKPYRMPIRGFQNGKCYRKAGRKLVMFRKESWYRSSVFHLENDSSNFLKIKVIYERTLDRCAQHQRSLLLSHKTQHSQILSTQSICYHIKLTLN